MAAKAKETGSIDFTMLYRLFFVIWFNADSGNLTFSENALCFQGFLCPLLFLLSQIWDKKGNHLTKHDFFRYYKYYFYSISRATLSVELVQVVLNLATPFPFNAWSKITPS